MIKWKLVLSFVLTIYIPLLYLLNIYIAVITPKTFSEPIFLMFIGIIIAFLGSVIWILSYINLGHAFGVLPKKQKKVKRGLYKYFNHPMYMGIYLTFLGLGMANASWEGLVYLNVVLVPLLFIRAYFEEKNLR